MIPKLNQNKTLSSSTISYLKTIEKKGFSGLISTTYSHRLMAATDNSIYQIVPDAILFPRTEHDLILIMRTAQESSFKHLSFSPRGGGTGTNGQSLSSGIIIDCSRFMRNVIKIDPEKNTATVQPGVILDQLNDALKPHQRFFAPNLSPSGSATIGGMISTDACGMGSRIYGRTSDHIESITLILANGKTVIVTNKMKSSDIDDDETRCLFEKINTLLTKHHDDIENTFPKITRFLTGYNLEKTLVDASTLNLNYLIAGSEGTLGLISEATVRLTPTPSFKIGLVFQYASLDHALAHAQTLLAYNPHAIETIDDKIISLAKSDAIYHDVKPFINSTSSNPESAHDICINVVQFNGEDETELLNKVTKVKQTVDKGASLGVSILKDASTIKKIWTLRKKGVGLLGKTPGNRKPIAFMEDTVVPSEKILPYIKEIRSLLDHHKIDYALYGHVDVGCLHIRPLLDPSNPLDEGLIYDLTQDVFNIVQRYNGLMWGEHGRGFRSELGPQVFGETLYSVMRSIKTLFDPLNQLNPGKMATPLDSNDGLAPIKSPLKGHFDREITDELRQDFTMALSCNGNGACFDYKHHQVMCPSYKTDWDRRHSPKGRAQLLREWVRLLSVEKNKKLNKNLNKKINKRLNKTSSPPFIFQRLYHDKDDFSHDVYKSLEGCLSCKACAKACPVNVDISQLKSQFLDEYHTRYRRPIRDYLIGYIEELLHKFSGLGYGLSLALHNPISIFINRLLGLYNLPKFSIFRKEMLSDLSRTQLINWTEIQVIKNKHLDNTVILVPDSFTYFFRGSLIQSYCSLLESLGYNVILSPWIKTAKPLHIKGFKDAFLKTAKKTSAQLSNLASLSLPIIGMDPAMTLCLRDEYSILGKEVRFDVQLFQEWSSRNLQIKVKINTTEQPFYLLEHCSEKTLVSESGKQWQGLFKDVGLTLMIIDVGCCGMAGTYGHEHPKKSRDIYNLSWKDVVHNHAEQALCTGFSCQEQVKRFSHISLKHPVEILARHLGGIK